MVSIASHFPKPIFVWINVVSNNTDQTVDRNFYLLTTHKRPGCFFINTCCGSFPWDRDSVRIRMFMIGDDNFFSFLFSLIIISNKVYYSCMYIEGESYKSHIKKIPVTPQHPHQIFQILGKIFYFCCNRNTFLVYPLTGSAKNATWTNCSTIEPGIILSVSWKDGRTV
jgi:hypothetical protein